MDFAQNFDFLQSLHFIGVITGSILIALILAWLFLRTPRWLGKYHSKKMDEVVHKNMQAPVLFFLPALCVFIALFLFYPSVLKAPAINAFGKIILVFLSVWLLLCLVKVFSAFIKRRFDITNENNLRARSAYTQIAVIQRLVSFTVILLGFSSLFLLFENMRGIGVSLIASAGIAGIVLGFAAQKTLGNLLAGIQIALSQPIRIDDAVVVEGEWGWVEEITLTYVVIRIWDLRRLVLPISYFIENPFQNWTRTTSKIIGTVYLYTDYTMPVETIREKTTEILENHPKWNREVNAVQVTNCLSETMEIRILVSAKDSPSAWDLRCDVREKLIAFIQENYKESLPKTRAVLKRDQPVPAECRA